MAGGWSSSFRSPSPDEDEEWGTEARSGDVDDTTTGNESRLSQAVSRKPSMPGLFGSLLRLSFTLFWQPDCDEIASEEDTPIYKPNPWTKTQWSKQYKNAKAGSEADEGDVRARKGKHTLSVLITNSYFIRGRLRKKCQSFRRAGGKPAEAKSRSRCKDGWTKAERSDDQRSRECRR